MNIDITKFIPGITLGGTLFHVSQSMSTEALEEITPIKGLLLTTAIFFTVKKIIEVVVNKFGNEHMKNDSKLAPWLIAPAVTIGSLGLAGIITSYSAAAISVALVAYAFFYGEKNSNTNTTVKITKTKNFGPNFSSIAGMQDVKERLKKEIIYPLENKKLYGTYKLNQPKGILFYGKPGCGKTLFAEALAGELKLRFIEITAGDVASSYAHGTTQKIRQIFNEAISKTPCVLFMDEMDGIASERQQNSNNQHLNEEVTELTTQIDKAIAAGVIIIGATNRIKALDPAIVRDGRFDTKIKISLPDPISRSELFKLYLDGRPNQDIDYEKLTKMSEGFSCSAIKCMVEKAAKQALYHTLKTETKTIIPITMDILSSAT